MSGTKVPQKPNLPEKSKLMVNTITSTVRQDIQPEAMNGKTSGEDGIHLYYEVLLEEVEKSVEEYNEAAVDALRCSDYDSVRQLMDWSEKVKAHHTQIQCLQAKWIELVSTWEIEASQQSLPGPRVTLRFPDGLRTSGRIYRLPILASLAERGGLVHNKTIHADVHAYLESSLNEYDLQPLLSNPDQPRWRNTCVWCLDQLATENLIVAGSPRGSWEITGEGRAELARLQSHASENVLDLDQGEATEGEFGSDSDDDEELTTPSFASEEIAEGSEEEQ